MMSVSLDNNSCIKRSKSFGVSNSVSFNPFKRVCLSPGFTRVSTVLCSESESDYDDDDINYSNNQRKARKRAFSLKSRRSISFGDNRLNRAVSKYSDEDDNDEKDDDEKDEESVNSNQTIASPITKMKEINCISSSNGGFFQDSIKPIRKSSTGGDQIARNRCFEYLVGAIDEAWARYCDATSYAEDEVFNKNVEYLPNTPASIAFSEADDDEDEDEENTTKDEEDEGYKSASTNITEYDSEVDRKISTQPSSLKLQHLKDRLLKAKYYLQDYVDSYEEEDCISFWRRWDLVKYATIELVEDDDDDEVIESTIEELEKGRLYGCE